MKSIITTLFILSLFAFSKIIAQPLNNSFENWTNGDPNNWLTTDVVGFIDCVTQSSDAQAGSSSARLEVMNLSGSGYAPVLTSTDTNGDGHPVSQRYATFTAYYKFTPTGTDQLFVSVGLSLDDNTVVGVGAMIITATAGSWTQLNIPIYYNLPDVPTEAHITFSISNPAGPTTIGSTAYIDNLSFSGIADVEKISGLPDDFSLSQNYPNPFNPSTKIEYSIPEASFVQLKIYDILGNEVAQLVNEEQFAGTYRADFSGSDFASGLYIAQLRAGNYTKTIKMSLLK
ncbi:MAG: T9SS type A sorting domain-containing protein [Ignavibacteriaceae bacterium]|nr:T9SS type A sorting domain-containing protein [Ignavibacteriaceae bacterium]